MKRKQTKVRRKNVFKTARLCYSIEEADETFRGELTRSFSVGADRQNKARKQGFNIGRMHIITEKFAANMYGGGKVGLVGVLFSASTDNHASGDTFGKVVHGEPRKNLLKDVLRFFRMKSGQTNRVLKITERSFNAPAHGIELFEIIRREIKVRDNGFKRIL